MKSLKISLFALCMVVVNLVWAQGNVKTPEEIATQKSEQLAGQLSLSAQQKKEAYQAYLQNAQQMLENRAQYKNNVTEIRAADQLSTKTLDEAIDKILSPKQKAQQEKKPQVPKTKMQHSNAKQTGTDKK
jgi:hypothetical protein